jgi:hypothetical protein
MTTSSVTAPPRSSGRLLLALGLCLPVLGVVGYVVQLSAQRLTAPWYVPATATLGAGLIALSLLRARTVWRVLALLLVVLVAGAEWAFLLALRAPPYTGPVAVGQPFPAFATARADGASFTERDLEGDQNTVLVSFRGRW